MHSLEGNNKTFAPERVVITGFGLLTPIGSSFLDTVLSIRAKRSCYEAHETVLVADSPHGEILRGATITRVANAIIPRKLSGAHRAAALLALPLTECLADYPLDLRQRLTWNIISRTDGSEEVMQGLFSKMQLKTNVPRDSFLQSEAIRSEFFSRIALATETLLANKAEGIVIACVDSLCDSYQLEKLLYDGLLKDAANPYGIMAGEAAGVVFLERESTARKRGATIMARIAACGSCSEPHPWPSGRPSIAKGLTTAFHQAFDQLNDGGATVGQVISDENGERPRALEWSLTEGRIFPNSDKERILRHPAVFAGDAGGALGVVMLADALARMAWRRPPLGRIALAVSDDQGDRRVLCLEPGDQLERRSLFTALRQRYGRQKKTSEEI